jgi:2-isopropylmalate synthase
METCYGFKLPKGMHKEFADIIQVISETQGEVAPEQIMSEFKKHYLDKKEPLHFKKSRFEDLPETDSAFDTAAKIYYSYNGVECIYEATGNGPIDAVQRGLQKELGINIKVLDYSEHALGEGSNAQAAAYIHILDMDTKKVTYGVGISSNITRASIRSIFSAINRLKLS